MKKFLPKLTRCKSVQQTFSVSLLDLSPDQMLCVAFWFSSYLSGVSPVHNHAPPGRHYMAGCGLSHVFSPFPRWPSWSFMTTYRQVRPIPVSGPNASWAPILYTELADISSWLCLWPLKLIMFKTEFLSTSCPEHQLSRPLASLSKHPTIHLVRSQKTGSQLLSLSPFQNLVCYQVLWISLPKYPLIPSTSLHLFSYLHSALSPSRCRGFLPSLFAPSLSFSGPWSTLQAGHSFQNAYVILYVTGD